MCTAPELFGHLVQRKSRALCSLAQAHGRARISLGRAAAGAGSSSNPWSRRGPVRVENDGPESARRPRELKGLEARDGTGDVGITVGSRLDRGSARAAAGSRGEGVPWEDRIVNDQ